MSAPSGGAASAPQCACSNISIMQLFHELKQQFPGVPDHVVSTTISSHCHDRSACQLHLQCEAKKYISHLYPSTSLSGLKKQIKDIQFPQQCPNQLIIAKEVNKPKSIQVSSILPQKAICSYTKLDENQNENIVKEECDTIEEEEEETDSDEDTSGSGNNKQCNLDEVKDKETVDKDLNANNCPLTNVKTFQIIKSNKVTSGLNKKFCVQNSEEVTQNINLISSDKPLDGNKLKRPTTLEFSTEPQINVFDTRSKKESLSAPSTFPDSSAKSQAKVEPSVCTCQHKCCEKPIQDKGKYEEACYDDPLLNNESFPLNLSVNLNCRMDVLPGGNRSLRNHFQEPWHGNYSSPTNITSVNLTVCTPTGAVDDKRTTSCGYTASSDSRHRGFEGHVQITVSPASAQPPPIRVSSSTVPQSRTYFSPVSNMMPDSIDNRLCRQKARLQRLQNALVADRNRVASMQREVRILKGLVPNNKNLEPDVQQLRDLCQKLARQLDTFTANTDGEFYDNIYTGQRQTAIPTNRQRSRHRHSAIPMSHQHQQQLHPEEPNSSWQCHVCTFRNNALLNKCEQCDMPRIILVHADEEIRVELTPGRNRKILHYQN